MISASHNSLTVLRRMLVIARKRRHIERVQRDLSWRKCARVGCRFIPAIPTGLILCPRADTSCATETSLGCPLRIDANSSPRSETRTTNGSAPQQQCEEVGTGAECDAYDVTRSELVAPSAECHSDRSKRHVAVA